MVVRIHYSKRGSHSERGVIKLYYDIDNISKADPMYRIHHTMICEDKIMMRNDSRFFIYYFNLDSITLDDLTYYLNTSRALQLWEDILIARTDVKLKEFIDKLN